MRRLPVKEEAIKLVQALPEDATSDDLLDAIELRMKVAAGLADSAAGRTISLRELRGLLGLDSR